MEGARPNVAEQRAQTDASLGAERDSTDAAAGRSAVRAQRLLDDLVERDRILADEQLLRFREGADRMIARERVASPPLSSAVATERDVADEDKKAERIVTDALLEGERQRADAVVETERREHEGDRLRLMARRHDTDDQLSTERDGADAAETTLDQIKTALAEARNEQSRRDDVLGIVTHDLRNPLCVIAVNAQLIAEDTRETSTRDAAEEISLAAARMSRLLEDLLDLARIDSGTLRVLKRRHDVAALMAEVYNSYRPLFAERGLSFTVELPAAAIEASFDHDRVVQVLSNLLGNAMKFTPRDGKVALRIECHAQEVEFVLRDSGPGIHPDSLPHLFKRFWQIDNDARRGLGLGLYICDEIVKAHAGRLWVESDLGKGTTFRFTLPLR
jgi:signal transduction histidine kinase